MLRTLLVLIALPAAVAAGPWPRGTGQSFIALSSEQDLAEPGPDPYLSLYIEHGLGENLTASLSFGLKDADLDKAVLELSRSFTHPSRQTRYSVEIATGYDQAPLLRAGFSAGRNLEILGQDAWAMLRSRWTQHDDGAFLFDTDILMGIIAAPDTSLMFKLLTTAPSDSRFTVRLGTSAIYHVSDRTRIELGYISDITRTENIGKASLWLDF